MVEIFDNAAGIPKFGTYEVHNYHHFANLKPDSSFGSFWREHVTNGGF